MCLTQQHAHAYFLSGTMAELSTRPFAVLKRLMGLDPSVMSVAACGEHHHVGGAAHTYT